MSLETTIRPADAADLAAIHAIYTHHVLHGTATFDLSVPNDTEMVHRWEQLTARGYPYFVALVDGMVAGYAYAGPYRPRPGYRYTVEDSIYVDPRWTGQGLGAALLARLLAACRERGYRQMVAVIGDSANAASIRLHERFGFRVVGTLRAVGFKFERWIDSVLMQLDLSGGGS
jgi:phosphinothricin acetyltransferase